MSRQADGWSDDLLARAPCLRGTVQPDHAPIMQATMASNPVQSSPQVAMIGARCSSWILRLGWERNVSPSTVSRYACQRGEGSLIATMSTSTPCPCARSASPSADLPISSDTQVLPARSLCPHSLCPTRSSSSAASTSSPSRLP